MPFSLSLTHIHKHTHILLSLSQDVGAPKDLTLGPDHAYNVMSDVHVSAEQPTL